MKDKSLNLKSSKNTESIKEKTKPNNNSHKIQDLTTDTIDKLLIKQVLLGKRATSTAYKVKNIFTNNGYLCLKILNDELFKISNTKEKKKDLNWDDDDDDDEFEEFDNSTEIDIG